MRRELLERKPTGPDRSPLVTRTNRTRWGRANAHPVFRSRLPLNHSPPLEMPHHSAGARQCWRACRAAARRAPRADGPSGIASPHHVMRHTTTPPPASQASLRLATNRAARSRTARSARRDAGRTGRFAALWTGGALRPPNPPCGRADARPTSARPATAARRSAAGRIAAARPVTQPAFARRAPGRPLLAPAALRPDPTARRVSSGMRSMPAATRPADRDPAPPGRTLGPGLALRAYAGPRCVPCVRASARAAAHHQPTGSGRWPLAPSRLTPERPLRPERAALAAGAAFARQQRRAPALWWGSPRSSRSARAR
jgi:hypothetical protein